ncbi:MAG: hypothetical protein R1F52_01415 [Candidatus Nitrosoabyssus spongiisocia]|nr:MAG: hypothetical protein R1F52_01415 [Nitrosopumilaceae archaeon AB1(1)]
MPSVFASTVSPPIVTGESSSVVAFCSLYASPTNSVMVLLPFSVITGGVVSRTTIVLLTWVALLPDESTEWYVMV